MAIDRTEALARPMWPSRPFDPTRARLFYSDLADELVLFFDERPVTFYVDFIDAPGMSDAAVLVGEDTGDVVGVQVDLLLARAARARPAWAVLAKPTPPPKAVAALVADVADLFERYWTPAAPIENGREGRGEGRGDSAAGER